MLSPASSAGAPPLAVRVAGTPASNATQRRKPSGTLGASWDAGMRQKKTFDFRTTLETRWRKACKAHMGARALSWRTYPHPFLTGCQNRLDARPSPTDFVLDLFHAKPRDRGTFFGSQC